MIRKCLHCLHEFAPEFDTDAFCSTWCQQSWWMSSTAGAEWDDLEPGYKTEWKSR